MSERFSITGDTYIVRRPVFSLNMLDDTLQKLDEHPTDFEKLQLLLSNESFASALDVAAPQLLEQAKKELKERRSIESVLAVLRYFIRMCSRATPFGIFATVGLATGAHIAIEEREERWARLEIDGDVLWRIHGKVLSVLRTEPSSKFAINSSAYETMNGLRFLQRSQVGNAFSFRLVSFKRSPHLDAVFRDRHCSKTRYEYAKEIANSTEGLDIEDAYEFLDRLIDADFLRSTIDVSAIGWDNVDDYLAQFDRALLHNSAS